MRFLDSFQLWSQLYLPCDASGQTIQITHKQPLNAWAFSATLREQNLKKLKNQVVNFEYGIFRPEIFKDDFLILTRI